MAPKGKGKGKLPPSAYTKEAIAKRKARMARKAKRKNLNAVIARKVNQMKETQQPAQRTTDIATGGLLSTAWAAGNQILAVTPNSTANNGIQITQGTGEANRNGNRIRTTYAGIRFCATMLPYNAVTNPNVKPMLLKYWVISAKPGQDFSTLADVIGWANNAFDNGNTSSGSSRSLYDLMFDYNNDLYNVHTSGMCKLGYAGYTGTNNDPQAGNYNNNDFKIFAKRSLNLTKYCPKIIKFNDNDARPFSKPIWFVWAAYYADGTTSNDAYQMVRVRLTQHYHFKEM